MSSRRLVPSIQAVAASWSGTAPTSGNRRWECGGSASTAACRARRSAPCPLAEPRTYRARWTLSSGRRTRLRMARRERSAACWQVPCPSASGPSSGPCALDPGRYIGLEPTVAAFRTALGCTLDPVASRAVDAHLTGLAATVSFNHFALRSAGTPARNWRQQSTGRDSLRAAGGRPDRAVQRLAQP